MAEGVETSTLAKLSSSRTTTEVKQFKHCCEGLRPTKWWAVQDWPYLHTLGGSLWILELASITSFATLPLKDSH